MRRTRTKSQLTTALMALLASLIHDKPGTDLAFTLLATAKCCQTYADEIDPRVTADWEQQQHAVGDR